MLVNDRPARLHQVDPRQGLIDIGVGRMRRVAQRVDDPEIEVLQQPEALARNVAHVR